MEMINKAAYEDLKEAGMDNEQAVAIASHIPDWTKFTTRQDLLRMELRLVFYMVGLLVAAGVIDRLWS